METKTIPMRSHIRRGNVTVVNAVATIHKIFEEIAPAGEIHCDMTTTENNAEFIFSNNGIEATFRIQKGGTV